MCQHVGVSEIQKKQTTSTQSHTNTITFALLRTLLLPTIICCQQELLIMSQHVGESKIQKKQTTSKQSYTNTITFALFRTLLIPTIICCQQELLIMCQHVRVSENSKKTNNLKTVTHEHNHLCPSSHPSPSHHHLLSTPLLIMSQHDGESKIQNRHTQTQ